MTHDAAVGKTRPEVQFEKGENVRITGGPFRHCIGMGAGVIFKGSGFYETDYKHGKSYQAAKGEEKVDGAKKASDNVKKSSGESKPSPSSSD